MPCLQVQYIFLIIMFLISKLAVPMGMFGTYYCSWWNEIRNMNVRKSLHFMLSCTTFPQEGRWQPTEDITSCCQRVAATRLCHEKVEDTQLLLILMYFQLIHYYTHLIGHNQEVHAPINWDSAIKFVAPRSYRVRDFPEKLSLDSLPFNFLPWDFQLRTKICY